MNSLVRPKIPALELMNWAFSSSKAWERNIKPNNVWSFGAAHSRIGINRAHFLMARHSECQNRFFSEWGEIFSPGVGIRARKRFILFLSRNTQSLSSENLTWNRRSKFWLNVKNWQKERVESSAAANQQIRKSLIYNFSDVRISNVTRDTYIILKILSVGINGF